MVTRDIAIGIAKAFVDECRKNGLKFYKVLMFGSFVIGTNNEHSDVDLVLVSDQFTKNIFENLKLYSKVNIKYPRIETHSYPTEYFLKSDSFLESIKKNSIEIA